MENTESQVEIKFVKVHSDAILPSCKRTEPGTGDVGYDIYAVEDCIIPPKQAEVIPTGINVGYITPGYWFSIATRSGLGFNHNLQAHAGIIDPTYRGNLGVKIFNHHSFEPYYVKKGDRIAQIIVHKLIQPVVSWTDSVDNTERSEKGFGSSGR